MPLAQVKVIKGVFTDDEKREMIERVSEAIVSVEGESLREKTVVIIDEVASGDWGVGGKVLTTEEVKEMRASPAHAR
jgi:4-oxalocrotonate tautomerase